MNGPSMLDHKTETGSHATSPGYISPKPPSGKSRHRWWLWLLLLGAVGYGGYRIYQSQIAKQKTASAAQAARGASRKLSVVVVQATVGDIPLTLRALGSVTAFQTVSVKSRLDGQLTRVLFKEGQYVHQGDVLAEIDARPYEVQLAQAQGQLARDQAQLKNAQVDLQRYQTLWDEKVIAKQQLDTQAATVGQVNGTIEADKAQIDSAKLQLVYTKITAPLSGRVGLRLVDEGNIVHAADANGIVVITQLQPIAVMFSIPEDSLPAVLKKLRAGVKLTVQAFDRDGQNKLATGTLLTVDNQIDQSTGTSKLKSVFDNANGVLFPNQFVNIRLLLDTVHNAVIVPAAAVQRGPNGTFVYVISSNNTASVRPVTAGITEGNDIQISSGLKAGETVVIEGADKLTDGMKVDARGPTPHNAASPAAETPESNSQTKDPQTKAGGRRHRS